MVRTGFPVDRAGACCPHATTVYMAFERSFSAIRRVGRGNNRQAENLQGPTRQGRVQAVEGISARCTGSPERLACLCREATRSEAGASLSLVKPASGCQGRAGLLRSVHARRLRPRRRACLCTGTTVPFCAFQAVPECLRNQHSRHDVDRQAGLSGTEVKPVARKSPSRPDL